MKIRSQRETGSRGWGELVKRSQIAEDSPAGIKTTRRKGLLRKAVVSGQECCQEESLEKSTCKAEERGCMVETGSGREEARCVSGEG